MLALVLLGMIESNAAITIRSYSEDMDMEMRDMAKPFQGFYWNLRDQQRKYLNFFLLIGIHSMQG